MNLYVVVERLGQPRRSDLGPHMTKSQHSVWLSYDMRSAHAYVAKRDAQLKADALSLMYPDKKFAVRTYRLEE